MTRQTRPIADCCRHRIAVVACFVALAVLGYGILGPARDVVVAPLSAQLQTRAYTCTQSVVVSGNTAATAQLVALTAGKRVRVCGFVFSGAGATTAKLVRGTGTACATGTADLTGALELSDNTSVAFGSGQGLVASTGAGEALCWTNSGAVQVSGLVTYGVE